MKVYKQCITGVLSLALSFPILCLILIKAYLKFSEENIFNLCWSLTLYSTQAPLDAFVM